jgi:AraC family transcriptional regulator of adaptative response/methylated-DNA-[protein]-cysteine methyltransferase
MPETQSRDYVRIARAIDYLDRAAERGVGTEAEPSLDRVARSVGLSPFHFQRMFTRWAGVSPKRFRQFQRVASARQVLREAPNVLHASWDAGISGPGRLHDLFVKVEAVTPGEYRSGGEGMTIAWGIHDSPFGRYLLGTTDRGIASLGFLDGRGERGAASDLMERWPNADLLHRPRETRETAERLFAREYDRPLSLLLKGTNFQLKVWEALLRIPAAAVASYEEIATSVCTARAVRAVGAAVGANPIAWLIPCHRVIRKTGAFGGYRWGLVRKRAMLAWEAAGVIAD